MSSSPPVADVTRPLAARLAVSLIAALSMLLTAAPAHAAEVFTLSGTAVGQGGASLEGSPVDLVVVDGESLRRRLPTSTRPGLFLRRPCGHLPCPGLR